MVVPELSTEHLTTRRWVVSDFSWYRDALDEAVLRFTREHPLAEPAEWVTDHVDASQPFGTLAVLDGSGLVGNLGIEHHGDVVEFSYWIADGSRGRGYATELLTAASRWGRREFGPAMTFELRIHPGNLASIAVAQRAGYRMSGFRTTCDSCADGEGRVAIFTLEP